MASAKRMMIVEDEPADAMLLRRAINGVDPAISVDVVGDGDEALHRLLPDGGAPVMASAFPACIVLDLKLRRLDGHAVLETLKKNKRTRRIPVVILTSSSDPRDVGLAYDTGANSYLVKPVRAADLGIVAERLVDYWLGINYGSPQNDAR